jgi:hypothetical protein
VDIRLLADRAFQLAFFIHCDRQVAVETVHDAYWRHRRAEARARKNLNLETWTKVPLGPDQLLQKLLFTASAARERQLEATGISCDDLTVRFVEHLASWSLTHRAMYAGVAILRVLCEFQTNEALRALDNVNGPDKEGADLRRIKGRAFGSLKTRFNLPERDPILEVMKGEEHRFASRQPLASVDIELALKCLEVFTPWGTRHPIKAAEEPPYPSLPPRDRLPLDLAPIVELHRIHAFVEPKCCNALLLHLEAKGTLRDKLMIPKCPTRPSGNGSPVRTGGVPTAAERQYMLSGLGEADELQRRAVQGPVRVRVDGIDRYVADGGRPIELSVSAGTELVELVATLDGRDVVLATYFLIDEDLSDGDRNLTVEWPSLGQRRALGVAVPATPPDTLLAGLERLASTSTAEEWADRIRRWISRLEWRLPVVAPPYDLLAEARRGPNLPRAAVYDVLLAPQTPERRVNVPVVVTLVVGVEEWPSDATPPLVVLVAEDERKEPTAHLAVVDESVGHFVARIPDLSPGRYVVSVEPPDDSSVTA